MDRQRNFAQLCAVILIHEILPRLKKAEIEVSDFPPQIGAVVARAEYDGFCDRRKIRQALDFFIERHIDGHSHISDSQENG